jgi:hypothetical protein
MAQGSLGPPAREALDSLIADLAGELDRPLKVALHTGPARPSWWAPGMPEGLVNLLADFSYKPKWTFRLIPAHYPGEWMLMVGTWVPDIRDPEVWGRGSWAMAIPPVDMDADGWLHWLRDIIHSGPERHETDEWFTVGGKRPFDPHA